MLNIYHLYLVFLHFKFSNIILFDLYSILKITSDYSHGEWPYKNSGICVGATLSPQEGLISSNLSSLLPVVIFLSAQNNNVQYLSQDQIL